MSAGTDGCAPQAALPESTAPDDTAPDGWQVVRGDPSPEELAAVIAVLSAAAAPTPEPPPDEPSVNGWAARWRALRTQTYPGPGAWQTYRHV